MPTSTRETRGMAAPFWSRFLFRASRALNSFGLAQQILRDELLFAFLDPKQRADLTAAAYALNSDYVPGGAIFNTGLFAWEKPLLEHHVVPRNGRALVAAAGGGREVAALLERGYEVYAFEPVAPFLESTRRVMLGTSSVVVEASYEDLIGRAAGRTGPLDSCSGPFDLCLLGWGSLSHLTEPNSVVEVLRALHRLAPTAPVITSFILRSSDPVATNGSARKLRRAVRRALQYAGGRSVAQGLNFQTSTGFLYCFSQEELFELCSRAGYEIRHFSSTDYAHALLLPIEVSDGA